MQLAVLGIGLLGREIAMRLVAHGFQVLAWNRSPEKAASLAEAGIAQAQDAGTAIAASDCTLLLLSDAAAIRETLLTTACKPNLAGRMIVQMGTIAPEESRDIAASIERAGGSYLEAPVLGSLPEAREGRLIVMAGGDESLYQRCLPVFQALSEAPQRIGEIGQGAAVKLAMNQLIAGLTTSFAYSLGLVRDANVNVEQFMSLLRRSALYAPTFDKKLDKYLNHDYRGANFPLKHLQKDLSLFCRVAQGMSFNSTPLLALEEVFSGAIADGLADADYSAIYEALVHARGPKTSPQRPLKDDQDSDN
ncbi:MAG TPA: hydroxyacid dehydrogenase [Chromatiaceae bacterium]|jgi:3-hydroxyisobutyrate dehydrogenase|nr:MAG: NAD(P)-dependent oxidoreductase [Thiohalocapsa sp. PB-PSB1]HBG95827.1 hydroxyacid dehydrogenase [Chromatiaceae bacterium]HCS89160.1 hydroxyacid dehydrogenase [Chromatiaceae bacterium]